MKVRGFIKATVFDENHDKVVAVHETENMVVASGRQQICNWFLHDNHTIGSMYDGSNPAAGGNSLSGLRSVDWNNIRISHSNAIVGDLNRITYSANLINSDVYADYDDNARLIFTFDEPIDLKAVMMRAYTYHGYEGSPIEMLVTEDAVPDVSSTWTRVKWFKVPYTRGWTYPNGRPIHFMDMGGVDNPHLSYPNTKGVRFNFRNLDYNNHQYIGGIWFFENNYYPNSPSVFALGTDNTAVQVSDTSLGGEVYRSFFKRTLKPSVDEMRYVGTINSGEMGDITINEIGMFFDPLNGKLQTDANEANVMFSRAIFGTPWSKTSGEIVDIEYTLNIV